MPPWVCTKVGICLPGCVREGSCWEESFPESLEKREDHAGKSLPVSLGVRFNVVNVLPHPG